MNYSNLNKAVLLATFFGVLFFGGCIDQSREHLPKNEDIKNKTAKETREIQGSPKEKRGEENVETEKKSQTKEVSYETAEPMKNTKERVKIKPFGIFITPDNSPLERERFSGYHTGADFEILEGEEEKDIPVKAVCPGEILQKRTASGYGGLIAQSCEIEDKSVTVVYGHLDIESVDKEIGDTIKAGNRIGFLGKGESAETDGERKHLHLGIHKGGDINIKGYVDSEEKLSSWLNPCEYVCR
ncbi:MAG: M23 family metallopeptidase [Candidatus Moraniibacteriota bacterium]